MAETPKYVAFAEQLLNLAESKFQTLTPMEHILGFNHAIGYIAKHVQRETERLTSDKDMHQFMQHVSGDVNAINPERPIINWTPTKERPLPSCANPNCFSDEELFPDLLDPDGGETGGTPTVHATCQRCQTPHIIYLILPEEND